MEIVFKLYHTRTRAPDNVDEKLIGIYSTEEKANSAITRLKGKPGFRDFPDGFQVFRHELDRDGWVEGFVDESK